MCSNSWNTSPVNTHPHLMVWETVLDQMLINRNNYQLAVFASRLSRLWWSFVSRSSKCEACWKRKCLFSLTYYELLLQCFRWFGVVVSIIFMCCMVIACEITVNAGNCVWRLELRRKLCYNSDTTLWVGNTWIHCDRCWWTSDNKSNAR